MSMKKMPRNCQQYKFRSKLCHNHAHPYCTSSFIKVAWPVWPVADHLVWLILPLTATDLLGKLICSESIAVVTGDL